jgi:peptide/nickel transport system permease protein
LARYIAGRVAQAVLVLWAAYTVTFVVLYELPGNPVTLLLGGGGLGGAPAASAAQIAAIKKQYGLDQPLPVQYLHQLWNVVHLHFGTSISQGGRPVSNILSENLPPTLALAGLAVALTIVFAVALAFIATYVQASWLRSMLVRLPAFGRAFPTFFIGILLIQVFSFDWPILPAVGDQGFDSLILPAITMALPYAFYLAQILIRGMTDVLDQPYITTARAKGQTRIRIHVRHVLPNAVLPTLAMLGVIVGYTVTEAVVAETVFGRPGLGSAIQQAVQWQDVPTVQAIVLLAAVLFVGVNLLVDLVYPLLDPRITHVPTTL